MDSPTGRIIADAMTEIVVGDALGRRLYLRRISGLDRLRLFKALGADLAQNPAYLGMALLAAAVTAIDDVPVPQAVTEGQLEALVQRLGDAGLVAIAGAVAEQFSDEKALTNAGNSAGTPIS